MDRICWRAGALCLALIVALPLALPATAGAQPGAPASAAEAVAQAELYLRREHSDQALAELERGKLAPDAAENFDLHLMLARLYHDELRLREAFESAEVAESLALTPPQREGAASLLQALRGRYAPLVVRSSHPEVTTLTSVELEPSPRDRGMVAVEKKRVLKAVAENLRRNPQPLPAVLYLPFGDYLVEGMPVTVESGRRAELTLHLVRTQAVRDADARAEQSETWILGGILGGGILALSVALMLIAGS